MAIPMKTGACPENEERRLTGWGGSTISIIGKEKDESQIYELVMPFTEIRNTGD